MKSNSSDTPPCSLRFFGWSLAFWLVLAGAVFGLMHDLLKQPGWWWPVLCALMVVVLIGERTFRASRAQGRVVRVIAWAISIAGLVVVALALDWQREAAHGDPFFARFLVLSIILPGLVAVGLWIRRSRAGLKAPSWRADCAIAILCLVCIPCSGYHLFQVFYVAPAVWASEMKWEAIGRPMAEFEKQSLQPVEENASLRDLAKDLEPFGVKNLYRVREGENEQNTLRVSPGVLAIIDQAGIAPEDGISLSGTDDAVKEGVRYLTNHAADFDRLYEGILRREPPVWSCRPADGEEMRKPNFSIARELAQISTADACLKLQRGDTKGAETAVLAASRMVKNLDKTPIFVCYMVRCAIEGLLDGKVRARLPEDSEALTQIASDVETQREQFRRSMQGEAWLYLKSIDKMEYDPSEPVKGLPFRKSIVKWISWPRMELELTKASWLVAQQVQICGSPIGLAAPDLGASEIRKSYYENPTVFAPNLLRAHLRSNLFLVLREETGILRSARTQMQAGNSGALGEWTSAVVPGSKWIATGDAASNSVRLELSPLPPWVAGREVIEDSFFPVQPDGSQSWKFSRAL